VAQAIVETPPPAGTVPQVNVLCFGLGGCGKSSYVGSVLSALGTKLEMSAATVGGIADHVTNTYRCYPINRVYPAARVNLWDIWGISDANYRDEDLPSILSGKVPDNHTMAVGLQACRAADPARAIHSVLMFIPVGIFVMKEELQTQFKAKLEQAVDAGTRIPALCRNGLSSYGFHP